MKIWIVTSSYSPVLGGLQKVTTHLAESMQNRGHDLDVFTNHFPSALPAFEKINQVNVHRLRFFVPDIADVLRGKIDLFLLSAIIFPFTLVNLFIRMLISPPDIVHVHFPAYHAVFINVLWRIFKFPLIVTFHGYDVERLIASDDILKKDIAFSKTIRKEVRRHLDYADFICAPSNYLLNKLLQFSPESIAKHKCIRNGIDLAMINRQAPMAYEGKYIFSAGRLVYAKGFDLLISAFSKVSVLHQDVKLIIAGEGDQKESLLDMIDQLQLNDKVLLLGFLPPEQIYQWMKGAEFVIVPSRQEGFGLTVVEALAAKKTVLATNVGAIPEIVEQAGFQALLVEADDEEMAANMNWMLDNPQEVKLVEITAKIANEFSWNSIVEQYLKIFDSLKNKLD